MNERIIERIDEKIEACTRRLADDTVKLVRIRSVQSSAQTGAPFGKGVKEVLDTFSDMARESGFYCRDYGVGVVSAAMRDGSHDLGIWLHGDVVAEGEGWSYEPYAATEYKGCIVGRGATDNKGQLAAVFNLFKIFSELGVELKYNPVIYLGSNEETGMKDITGIHNNPDAAGFINLFTPPRLSLVPDGGFPVGYGGKGGINLTLRSKTPLRSCTFTAGQDASPGLASALICRADVPDTLPDCTVRKGEKTEIFAFSPPRHGASPDPNGNMITILSSALLDADIVADEEKHILEFFKDASLDVYGKNFGIDVSHEIMGKLTVFPGKVDCVDGYAEILLNIRYPLGITAEEIEKRVRAYAESRGFSISKVNYGVSPYMLDPNTEIVRMLCETASAVIGEELKPYTISGCTYAHLLPNAYVYGMNGCLPPDDFPKGRGGAHGIDESVSLDRLKRAMKIYARALLALNDMEW